MSQGYGYGYPQYPQAFPQQGGNQFQALENRIRELEQRNSSFYQNPNDFQQNQNGDASQNAQANTQPAQSTSQSGLIIVKSKEEAWSNYPDTISGNKQHFYDEANDVYYAQWFDAFQAKTFREIYQRIIVEDEPETNIPENSKESLPTIIGGIANRLDGLENQMSEIKEMIQNGKNLTGNLEVDRPKVSRSKRSNGKSDGSGEIEQ